MKVIEKIIAVAMVLVALLLVAPTNDFGINLIQSFNFWASLAFLFISIPCLLLSVRLLARASFFSFLLVSANFLWAFDYGKVEAKNADLTVFHCNVLTSNDKITSFIRAIHELEPDFLSIQELNCSWKSELIGTLSKQYPYFVVVPSDRDSFGLGVFSKYPLSDIEIKRWQGTPNITGEIVLDNGAIPFVSSHTHSPVKFARYYKRNGHIHSIAKHKRDSFRNEKGLIMGDFNATPWDPAIQNFKRDTGMVDSRKKLTLTFPAKFPIIPIDYIFHSKGLQCLNFKAVPVDGSDHIAIFGSYAITP